MHKAIEGYCIEEDGLETVKNQGRQDIKDRWQEREDYWVKAITECHEDTKNGTKQIINPDEHLSYQMPEKPFEIYEEDFVKMMMDYEMFRRGIDAKSFGEYLLDNIFYASTVAKKGKKVTISLEANQ